MRLSLDTHTFLWFIQGNSTLSETAKALIEDRENVKLISTASLWEIAIKISISKLEIGMSLTELVRREIIGNSFRIFGRQPEHLNVLSTLPFHHKDPFDRLIISQGMSEGIPVASKDAVFSDYSIESIW